MTDPIEALAATQNGAPDPMSAAEQLAALLDLGTVGLSIRGARIVGRGARASADLRLSDGSEITFEALRDVANPTRLAVEVAACTGATPKIKAPGALRAVALLRALAEHEEDFTADQLAIDWATSFLQSAARLDVDMNDQAARWEAFCALERTDPHARSRENGGNIAAACTVLLHTDGVQLVRCGWFRAHARGEDPGASAQEIAHRALRAGWQRRGTRGAIKATRPGHRGQLVWSFYTVPVGWETNQ
jgi:hypothetical protein